MFWIYIVYNQGAKFQYFKKKFRAKAQCGPNSEKCFCFSETPKTC